ncbi:MAG: hypothetical protein WJU30_00237 [Candidatus Phytoplasma pruni]
MYSNLKKKLNITTILRTILIKRGVYYYWLRVKEQLKQKAALLQLQTKRIKILCQQHQYFYGHRKITFLYQQAFNQKITPKRVYKIMKTHNISCCLRKKKNKFSYKRMKSKLKVAANLINQDFKATRPLQKLFTDITYFKTDQNFLYFSCVVDAFNNQIIAYHISHKPNKELILNTIKKLPALKKPCFFHSDQGAVYQSAQVQQILTKKGFLISMSRAGTPRDNAVVENVFCQMKSMLETQHPFLYFQSFETIKKIIQSFSRFWNRHWLLTKLNYQTPLQYVQNFK